MAKCPRKHRYDSDTDACACGGQVVWFADLSGYPEGCDVEGRGWPMSAASPAERRRLEAL